MQNPDTYKIVNNHLQPFYQEMAVVVEMLRGEPEKAKAALNSAIDKPPMAMDIETHPELMDAVTDELLAVIQAPTHQNMTLSKLMGDITDVKLKGLDHKFSGYITGVVETLSYEGSAPLFQVDVADTPLLTFTLIEGRGPFINSIVTDSELYQNAKAEVAKEIADAIMKAKKSQTKKGKKTPCKKTTSLKKQPKKTGAKKKASSKK